MLRRSVALFQQAPRLVKQTTGITGLDVVPDARAVLMALYEKTLRDITIIPEGVFYRTLVESTTQYRLRVLRENEDEEKAESIIGKGQLEELIEIAKDELELIPAYASWRWWELPPAEPEDDDYEELYEGLSELTDEALAAAGVPHGFDEILRKNGDIPTEAQWKEFQARINPPPPPAAPAAAGSAAGSAAR